jgi:hypothetical protein
MLGALQTPESQRMGRFPLTVSQIYRLSSPGVAGAVVTVEAVLHANERREERGLDATHTNPCSQGPSRLGPR